MSQPSIKKNYIYNTLYEILAIIAPLITAPYVSRVFGADGVGIYSYTSAITAYFTMFSAMGIKSYGQREIAQHRENPQECKQQVVAQRCDLRPVLDVGAKLEQGVVIALAKALIHAGVVAGSIVLVLRHGGIVINVGGGGQDAAVGGSGCNAAGIHQCHTGQLAAAGLGALAAGEVAGGVTDGQCAVCGHIACAEAGAAEGGADGGTAGHQLADDAGAHQFHHDGLAAGVNAQGVVAAAAGVTLEDGSSLVSK